MAHLKKRCRKFLPRLRLTVKTFRTGINLQKNYGFLSMDDFTLYGNNLIGNAFLCQFLDSYSFISFIIPT